jgi:putative molybdopterin biosynthesis protein
MIDDFRQSQFLVVIDRDEAISRFRRDLDLSPLEPESVALAESLGRVTSADIRAPVDVPAFDRSNVDGFAVRAADTFGASESSPLTLSLRPKAVRAGDCCESEIAPGWAIAVATGAVVPRGASAVVMVEHSEIVDRHVVLKRPAEPGSNITYAGTDIGRGETVLFRGTVLTSRETGVLAALGLERVDVVRRPRVAVISTGDELREPGANLPLGCVSDSNSRVLADTVRELGCDPVSFGIVPDDIERLRVVVRQAVRSCDAVLLSGGTSKGASDVSYRVVDEFGPPGIVVHGVALKPGKPLCLAVAAKSPRAIPVAVLPGFPTSAIFAFQEFIASILIELAGRPPTSTDTITAVLPSRVNSERGRTEFVLVGLVSASDSSLVAVPMGKGSGSVTAFGRADGFITIPRQREYLEAGEHVEVRLLGAGVRPADLVVIGSHCIGLDYLLGRLRTRGITSKVLAVGSSAGLEAARRGHCDLAGVHLLDPNTDSYNRPFLDDTLDLIPGYGRMQGIVYRRGDPRFEGKDVAGAVEAVLADPGCVLVNRNAGSGTRVLVDRLLRGAKPAGYLTEAKSHSAVVAAVVQGRADWGIAIEPAAREVDLGFIPLRDEQFDFVVPRSRFNRPAVAAFRELLADESARNELRRMGFRV